MRESRAVLVDRVTPSWHVQQPRWKRDVHGTSRSPGQLTEKILLVPVTRQGLWDFLSAKEGIGGDKLDLPGESEWPRASFVFHVL